MLILLLFHRQRTGAQSSLQSLCICLAVSYFGNSNTLNIAVSSSTSSGLETTSCFFWQGKGQTLYASVEVTADQSSCLF